MKYFKSGKFTEKQIDVEYRRLSRKHHPDMPTGSKESFQELAEEYKIIKMQYANLYKERGDNANFNRVFADIRSVDDFVDAIFVKYNIPEDLKPIVKQGVDMIGDAIINELNKKFLKK